MAVWWGRGALGGPALLWNLVPEVLLDVEVVAV